MWLWMLALPSNGLIILHSRREYMIPGLVHSVHEDLNCGGIDDCSVLLQLLYSNRRECGDASGIRLRTLRFKIRGGICWRWVRWWIDFRQKIGDSSRA